MTAISTLTPRTPLTARSVNYNWGDKVAMFEAIFRDYTFFEMIERYFAATTGYGAVSTQGFKLIDTAFRASDLFKRVTDQDFSTPCTRAQYGLLIAAANGQGEVDEDVRVSFAQYITAWAAMAKTAVFDALFVVTDGGIQLPAKLEFNAGSDDAARQREFQAFYGCIEPVVDGPVREAIKMQIELHPEFATIDEDARYTLDLTTEINPFISTVLKCMLFELFRAMIIEDLDIDWEQPDPIPLSPAAALSEAETTMLEVELGLISRDPDFRRECAELDRAAQDAGQPGASSEDVTAAAAKYVSVKVKRVLSAMGIPIRSFQGFSRSLAELSAAAKESTLGLYKSRVVKPSGAGSRSRSYVHGRALHRANARTRAMSYGASTSKLISHKIAKGTLPIKGVTTEVPTVGGDIDLMVDCTGSTLSNRGKSLGLNSLLEAICYAMIDAAVASKRRINIHFYNEGTSKFVSLGEKPSPSQVRRAKTDCIGNGQAAENNEISTFEGIFEDIRRHPQYAMIDGKRTLKKRLILFISDGGMLTGMGDRVTAANRLKLMINEKVATGDLEVLPLLIHKKVDRTMRITFAGKRMMHVPNKESFKAKHLKSLISEVRKYDPACDDEGADDDLLETL